ncbi:FAD binding domain-containing protein [Desulfogranum mediterraneum]|uniref:FAD binding domain-containing protein n=1 Tax=Desulfogranum mediterraneum TaxID=160661 RepID=UPI00040FEA13|nr:FAD binding domain-containing protein [Desulfogranum mediterraneum]
MLQIERYVLASDLKEAYELLTTVPGSAVLGGCGYLRLGARAITTAIDLSALQLDYVRENGPWIEIGAMTSLRSMETHPLLRSLAGGVLPRSLGHIVGVQLRAAVTIGGTVAGRYPFSDPLTALLALEARVHLHQRGVLPLEEFLSAKPARDVVVQLSIPRDERLAAFGSVRRAQTDYAVLNAAVSRKDEEYRLVVGSRPGRAMLVPAAAAYLRQHGLSRESIVEAAGITVQAVPLGTNPRGSEAYRRAVCPVLIKRLLSEVLHGA